jgi:protein disulfide-isomerase A6
VICILSFLPNIYDSNANERNGYLQSIATVAQRNRRHPFQFFWLQAGDQMDTERQLNLGFGFPAVVAISPNKSKFAILKGSFSEDKLGDFLSDLMSGKVSLDDLKAKLAIKKADKWDGKDAKPLEEVLNSDLIINFRSHTTCEKSLRALERVLILQLLLLTLMLIFNETCVR